MSAVQKIADTLEREGQNTLAFFDDLSDEQWAVEVYSDGDRWTVHHLLAHFTEVEGSIPKLINRIVGGDPGVAEDFDIDRWNARYTMEMSAHDRDYLLAEFKSRRAATVAMVRSFSEDDLDASGRHPFLGPAQVKDMLKLMYIHLMQHQRDIRNALNR
jgi:uncharacterized damage-inducible protein DinB